MDRGELINIGLTAVIAIVGDFWRRWKNKNDNKREAYEIVEDIAEELYIETVKPMIELNADGKLTKQQKSTLRLELGARLRKTAMSKGVKRVVDKWSTRRLNKIIKRVVKAAKKV